MAERGSIARVMIDSPLPQLDRLFDYAVPIPLRDQVAPGVRVRIPLRSAGRVADGYIIELTDRVDYPGPLSDLEQVISPIPVLAAEVWTLIRTLADRAAGTASDIVRVAVPKRHSRVEKAYLDAGRTQATPAPVAGPPAAITGYDNTAWSRLIHQQARLALDAIPRVLTDDDGTIGHWAVTLAQLAAMVLSTGKSVIVALPDYRDQEQFVSALGGVVPAEAIVALDAKQTGPSRYRNFLRCLSDEPQVIIGNRAVVYAPCANLGAIVVWDDGDPLFREPLAPYVHTRDAALIRSQQQHCALILASHARSTEVQRLVEMGWMTAVAPDRKYAPSVIPTLGQTADSPQAAQARIPSSAWKAARDASAQGPVLVQVARPGYAPKMVCDHCHHTALCAHCTGPLAQASAHSAPTCTWCAALATGWECSECGGARMRTVGRGTVRTAEDLGRAFPGVRIIIADGERPILQVSDAPSLVIATRGAEPIADGGYRAVLLLDGDRMLARESLRIGENCLRWWANAAARAAPGAPVMLVGVGGALAAALATWRLPEYVAAELADRRPLRFPPAVRLATVSGSSAEVDSCVAELSSLDGVDVLGPAPDPAGSRAIIRFDYRVGEQVATTVKAAIVRNATTRRKRFAPGAPRRAPVPTLKARFDDPEPSVEE